MLVVRLFPRWFELRQQYGNPAQDTGAYPAVAGDSAPRDGTVIQNNKTRGFMSLNLDPNGAIYKYAVEMGYSNPDAMSDGQLQRVILDMAGALPSLPPSPFNPQPLTPAQQQQVLDRQAANDLVSKIGVVMETTASAFQRANDERWVRIVANMHAVIPGPPDIAAVQEYDRLQTLLSHLWDYLGGVTGWAGNIGQAGHESEDVLIATLKAQWPDADAAVH